MSRRPTEDTRSEKRRGVAHFVTYWGMVLVTGFQASVASALTPDLELTQLGHTAWRVQDGVLPGPPTAIAQTNDGYMWIGTHDGLVRFDGASFIPVVPPRAQTPHFPRITALYGAKDGSLWVGTSSQLGRWKAGEFRLYDGLGFFADIGEGPDGTIWAARQHTGDGLGPLCEVRESKLSCHGQKEGIPFRDGTALAIDPAGTIWIAAPNKLARWLHGQAQVFAPPGLSRSEGLEGFKSIVVAPDGSIWSGVVRGGPGLGLQHFTDGSWKSEVREAIDTSDFQVNALLFDRDNSLWVGTANHGIYRLGRSRIDHFGVSDGLSADAVTALSEDREGNIWVLTTMGIDKFRSLRAVTISSRQGLSAEEADAVLVSKTGAIWISNATALDKIDHGTVKSYSQREGLPGQSPTALFEDSRGRLWVGVDDGVGLLEGERFTRISSPHGPVGAILQFAGGADSTVWGVTATLPSRLVRMNSAEVLESFPPPPGYRLGTFAAAPDGGLWFEAATGAPLSCDLVHFTNGHWEIVPLHNPPGTGCRDLVILDAHTVLVLESQGIAMWRDGGVRKLGVESGLPCASTFGGVLDGHRNLWLSMQCGLATVTSQQLFEWSNQPSKTVEFRLFNTSDGVLPGSAEFHPRASVGLDGKIWFANGSVVQFLDPEHWLGNSVIPPVHIQALEGDGHTYNPGSPISLPPLTRDVQIDFTALSFVVPQRVQFRYRLDEWDKDWLQPVGRRHALYSNLPPGQYRFSVIASNDEGIWNTKGDSLEFRIPPAYYQTWWFRTLCALLFVAALAALYRMRVAQVRSETRRLLEARLAERERIARDLHDTLLQGVQGLIWRFQSVNNRIPPEQPARQLMEQSLDRADKLLEESRDRVKDLRPAAREVTDLALALAAEGDELAPQYSAKFRVTVQGERRDLHPIVREEALLIGREALRNAFRHAGAKDIEAELTYDEAALHLRVRDDGRGISGFVLEAGGTPGHFGLIGMQERAKKLGGLLEIWSKPEAGTEIELKVPANVAYVRLSGSSGLRSMFAIFRRRAHPH